MDEEIIIKRLDYMREKLKDLDQDLNNYESFSSKKNLLKTIRGAIERWCEEIVESAVTINNELLSSINKVPDSYYKSFIELESLNIFNEKDLEKLASTAGYRNRLAHDYMNIDPEISINSAKNILNIYKKYIKEIYSYLENKKD